MVEKNRHNFIINRQRKHLSIAAVDWASYFLPCCSLRPFVILLVLKISFRTPFRSYKKSHHSQSYRVLIFSGEIITKNVNCEFCENFHLSSGVVELRLIFFPFCSSIRSPSSPQNFLSYAVSIVQKVLSQPKLSRFDL